MYENKWIPLRRPTEPNPPEVGKLPWLPLTPRYNLYIRARDLPLRSCPLRAYTELDITSSCFLLPLGLIIVVSLKLSLSSSAVWVKFRPYPLFFDIWTHLLAVTAAVVPSNHHNFHRPFSTFFSFLFPLSSAHCLSPDHHLLSLIFPVTLHSLSVCLARARFVATLGQTMSSANNSTCALWPFPHSSFLELPVP